MGHAGDQEDVSVLNEIVEDAAQFSGYDIIVDDGGHKASQMLASFRVHPFSPELQPRPGFNNLIQRARRLTSC